MKGLFVWFLSVYLTKIFARAGFHVSLQLKLMLGSVCFQADFALAEGTLSVLWGSAACSHLRQVHPVPPHEHGKSLSASEKKSPRLQS